MSTVGKASRLLEAFDIYRPELGLSELTRIAGFDKATTHRLLTALGEGGLVERNPVTRLYRLGPAVVRFARIREHHFPITEIAKPMIDALCRETGETAHLAEFDGGYLTSLYVAESDRANRISVSVGDRLPLNATASGMAFMAFGPDREIETYLSGKLERSTPRTLIDPILIRAEITTTRQRGYSIGDQGREEGVFSVGAPILGSDDIAIATVAVAAPRARVDDIVTQKLGLSVTAAAAEISRRLFGERSSPQPLQRSV